MSSDSPKIVFRYADDGGEEGENGHTQQTQQTQPLRPARLPKLTLSQRMSLPLDTLIGYESRSKTELRHFTKIEWVRDAGGEEGN